MFKMIMKAIKSTINTGIGQSIIAFGAWGYSLLLLIITMIYAVLCLVKFILNNKRNQ